MKKLGRIAFFILIICIKNGDISFAKDIVSTDEIYIYIDEQIKIYSEKYEIPSPLLRGMFDSQKISRLKNEYMKTNAYKDMVEYIKENEALKPFLHGIENGSSIVRLINFISLSIKIHFIKLEKFFTNSNLEIQKNNLWTFASISFLFGNNVSLEILNHYSSITSPRFLRHMLVNEILLKNYLCNKEMLWNFFIETSGPMIASEKRKQMLEFLLTINYCRGEIE